MDHLKSIRFLFLANFPVFQFGETLVALTGLSTNDPGLSPQNHILLLPEDFHLKLNK